MKSGKSLFSTSKYSERKFPRTTKIYVCTYSVSLYITHICFLVNMAEGTVET